MIIGALDLLVISHTTIVVVDSEGNSLARMKGIGIYIRHALHNTGYHSFMDGSGKGLGKGRV